jgi:AAA domain-containing protein
MKDASTYQSAQELGILLIGESGSGKTCLMCEFADIYILDCDHNLASGLRLYEQRHGRAKEDFWYDAPEIGTDGKRLPDEEVWPNGCRLLDAAAADPRVKAIGIDGLTAWMTYLQRFVVKQGSDMEPKKLMVGGMQMMTKSFYAPFEALMRRFVVGLRSLGKHVVVTAHVRSGESELTDAPMWQPYLVGGLRNTIPGLFTDYWLCDTEQVVPGAGVTTDVKDATGKVTTPARYPTGTRYFVRTAPTAKVKLKNSRGLPPVFEFTWAAFAPFLNGVAKPVAPTTTTPTKP